MLETQQAARLEDRVSKKVAALRPSGIRAFFDIVSEREDCVSLGVGEPDFVTPQVVVDTAITGLRNGYTHYTGNQGLPSLRKAVADYLKHLYGLEYNPSTEILITVGVSQGMDIALRSILNQGDGVLYPRPSYVSYSPLIEMAGGIAQNIETAYENNFAPQTADIAGAYTDQSKVVFINYPSNPTGASFDEDALERLRSFVLEKDLLVISDEIYGELCYEKKHIPFATLKGMKERTVLLNGFSKSFAMTGWRIGYAAGPEWWVSAMTKIQQYSMLCAPTIGQIAAEAALKYANEDRVKMLDQYRKRRDFIVNSFNDMGLECHRPDGAFYVFPKITSTGLSSLEFAEKLLDQKNVAVVPGTAFGYEGEGFIRCSFATGMKDLEIAADRIREFIQEL